MSSKPLSKLDKKKAIESVERGRRKNWWRRLGGPRSGFRYETAVGKPIKKEDDLSRIAALAIPPAWSCVRINPASGGKIQAVGIDGTGRIQYLYNETFTRRRQKAKFAKIERFGDHLPRLYEITSEHIGLDGLPRDKVLAVVMRLINSLYFRVGTEMSELQYKTYGVTTLHKRHLAIGRGGKLEFNFVGKSHVEHRKVLVDKELAGIVSELAALGRGRKLFRYIDEEGKPRPIRPAQINRYIKQATGPEFSSKDFRTWGATLLAAIYFAEAGVGENDADTKKKIVATVKKVAEELGNTPSVCRGSYIHPCVIKSFESGITLDEFRPKGKRAIKGHAKQLEPEELALVKLLQNGKAG